MQTCHRVGNAVLGDGDSNLSGGQLRNCLCTRVDKNNRNLLAEDEVSSNLDEKTTIESVEANPRR